MNLAENIKRIRKDNNLSQEQLAEKLNVSRQSVSKWESGLSYPEMDKMLQICKMFNVGIDDLMQSDIREVNNQKKSKNNFTKYVDSFLSFITKATNMFASLKLKGKIKCLFEQGIIVLLLFIITMIIGSVGEEILRTLFAGFPIKLFQIIYGIIKAIYLTVAIVMCIMIWLHIFKIRYLDYFIENEDVHDEEVKDEMNNDDIVKENKEEKNEKVIIRDPNHSGYNFFTGLAKIVLFFIKTLAVFAFLFLSFGLAGASVGLVLIFSITKAKLLFTGLLLAIIAAIVIIITLECMLFNFVFNRRIKKGLSLLLVLGSIILFGLGAGIFSSGVGNINVIDELASNEIETEVSEIEMRENLYIETRFHNAKYVSKDIDNIEIEVKRSKYAKTYINDYQDNIYLYIDVNEAKLDFVKTILKDLNNYEIKDYYNYTVTIYASEENIAILKQNAKNHDNYEKQIEERFDEYEIQIRDYEEQIRELQEKLYTCEENLEN